VAGGNFFSTELFGVFQKGFKFDFAVAEDIRIWSTASPILIEEFLEDILPVLRGKIACMQVDTYRFCDGFRISNVLCG